MADWIDTIATYWFWFCLALLLGIAALLGRGLVLLWIGTAAIIVGTLDLFSPISIPFQVALFAVLSILTVFAGKKFRNDYLTESSEQGGP